MTTEKTLLTKSDIDEICLWAETFTHWNKLRSIQNSKIISSTYVWLFLVPLIAKFLSKINDSISITINENVYEFSLKLPFSWEIFFYSSLCFVIGNVLFIIFAPELIKDFKDYGEYLGSRRMLEHLNRYTPKKHQDKHKTLEKVKKLAGLQGQANNGEKIFWDLYEDLNIDYPYLRYICALLYCLGFILFAWVVTGNIFWVLTH